MPPSRSIIGMSFQLSVRLLPILVLFRMPSLCPELPELDIADELLPIWELGLDDGQVYTLPQRIRRNLEQPDRRATVISVSIHVAMYEVAPTSVGFLHAFCQIIALSG